MPDRAMPRFDTAMGTLTWNGRVVLRLRRRAPNLRLILTAFEEHGWPERIDDPLPSKPGGNGKRRLHDAIVDLNQRVKPLTLRFHGDGTGEGVYWEKLA